jgi:hypothetical protein
MKAGAAKKEPIADPSPARICRMTKFSLAL